MWSPDQQSFDWKIKYNTFLSYCQIKSIISLHRLRAPSHVKFCSGVKFPILIQIEKLLPTVVTRHVSISPGRNEYFFTLFQPRVELYMQRFAVYFTKLFRGKSMFCMQLQDYIKAMMLDFINKRSKAFIDFKWFKIVSLAAISSIIFIASLSLNLYTVLLLNIYDQRRQLDILKKDAIISRNIAFEMVNQIQMSYVKVIKLFWR